MFTSLVSQRPHRLRSAETAQSNPTSRSSIPSRRESVADTTLDESYQPSPIRSRSALVAETTQVDFSHSVVETDQSNRSQLAETAQSSPYHYLSPTRVLVVTSRRTIERPPPIHEYIWQIRALLRVVITIRPPDRPFRRRWLITVRRALELIRDIEDLPDSETVACLGLTLLAIGNYLLTEQGLVAEQSS